MYSLRPVRDHILVAYQIRFFSSLCMVGLVARANGTEMKYPFLFYKVQFEVCISLNGVVFLRSCMDVAFIPLYIALRPCIKICICMD